MPKVDRAGIFHAIPTDAGVDCEGDAVVVKFAFKLTEEKVDGTFYNIEGENLDATNWVFMFRKDGEVGKPFLALYDIFPQWDGLELPWFQDADLSNHTVQLTIGLNDAGDRFDVQFMNPYGSTGGGGGVTHADDATKKRIDAQVGSTLRALAPPGRAAAPQPTAPKPAPAPAAPVATPSTPPTAAPPATPGDSTLDEAWATFSRACPADFPQDEQEAIWFTIIAKLFKGKSQDDLTPAEWGKMNAECVANIPPF